MKKDKRSFTRLSDQWLAAYAWQIGCTELNIGDGHRLPGLASYKFELKPKRLGFYVNCLDHEEMAD